MLFGTRSVGVVLQCRYSRPLNHVCPYARSGIVRKLCYTVLCGESERGPFNMGFRKWLFGIDGVGVVLQYSTSVDTQDLSVYRIRGTVPGCLEITVHVKEAFKLISNAYFSERGGRLVFRFFKVLYPQTTRPLPTDWRARGASSAATSAPTTPFC